MSNITLYQGDCLEEMKKIPDKSVDLILCDLPYGTTSCSWDVIIPFEDLWKEYKRIITNKGVIALFGDGRLFTAKLMLSNEKWFKYNWYWKRSLASNFLSCKKQPRFRIETISIFYNKQPIYNTQMEEGKPYKGRTDTNKINTSQTTVNAKRVGTNLSIRNSTTIGNKMDGRKDLLPTIGDNVTIGANVVVIGDITIGYNVTIGAGSVIVKDIPDYAIVVGNPQRIIGYKNH